MLIKHPCCICSDLRPGVRISGMEISIDYYGASRDGRTVYEWHIYGDCHDLTGHDLKSGVGGGSLQEGLESLLTFLGAFAESYPDGENADLFPAELAEWAQQNSDEISMASLELEETPNVIEE